MAAILPWAIIGTGTQVRLPQLQFVVRKFFHFDILVQRDTFSGFAAATKNACQPPFCHCAFPTHKSSALACIVGEKVGEPIVRITDKSWIVTRAPPRHSLVTAVGRGAVQER